MTGWRVGLAMKPENPAKFGQENSDGNVKWHFVGVGMDFTITENNGFSSKNGMGSKVPELLYEGRFSCTWSCNMYLDYNNLFWLAYALENYAFKTENYTSENGHTLRGVHKFGVSNSKSLKPVSLRLLKLNREVGGPFDEKNVMLGCVIDKVTFNYDASSSAIKVAIGGKCVDVKLSAMNLDDTIDQEVINSRHPVKPAEWGCLQILSTDNSKWEAIANNESTSFTIGRSVTTVPACGSRVDTAYFESNVGLISVGARVYSRNPNQWQTRMHTGGVANDLTVGGTSSPRRKGLQPIPNLRIASSSLVNGTEASPDYSCTVDFRDIAVDSWGNTYNSQSEITESPSLKAKIGEITIKTCDLTEAIRTPDSSIVTVTFNLDGGSGNAPVTMSYMSGETIILPTYAGSKSGYTFGGWSDGTTPRQPDAQYTVPSQDVTMTAIWSSNTPEPEPEPEPTEPTE